MYKTRGFTLVEISIVLVIIGLLTGAVLKGQQMIENSRYKAWVREINELRAAINIFQDRYRALPGDFSQASSKLPAPTGVTVKNGNGNGVVENGFGKESSWLLHHLVVAGLIAGDPSINNYAVHSMTTAVGGRNGNIGHGDWANGVYALKAMYHNTPVQYARRYDEEFDDGHADSGEVACYTYGGDAYVESSQCTGGADWPADGKFVAMFVTM